MKKLERYENVDLFKFMQSVISQKKSHYCQDDFEIDKEILAESPAHRNWVWLVRDGGTNIALEEIALTANSAANKGIQYYAHEDRQGHTKAYIICDTRAHQSDPLTANIYELNFQDYAAHIEKVALSPEPGSAFVDPEEMKYLQRLEESGRLSSKNYKKASIDTEAVL